MFPDAYQPFALASVTGRSGVAGSPESVDMGPYFRRRGLVFVDGKPLEPMEQLRELASPHLQPAPGLTNRPCPETACPRAARWPDHAGNRGLARCQVLGRELRRRYSHSFARRHARRSPDRNHHPRTSLRSNAKGSCLHPGQGNHLPARRQRLPVSATRPGLHRRRQSLDHRRQHHRMGQWRRHRHRQRRRMAVSRSKPGRSDRPR